MPAFVQQSVSHMRGDAVLIFLLSNCFPRLPDPQLLEQSWHSINRYFVLKSFIHSTVHFWPAARHWIKHKDKNLPCLKRTQVQWGIKIKPLSDFSIMWYVPKVIHSIAASTSAWLGVEWSVRKRQVKVVEKGSKKNYALCQVLRANEVAVAQWVMRKTGNSRNTGLRAMTFSTKTSNFKEFSESLQTV